MIFIKFRQVIISLVVSTVFTFASSAQDRGLPSGEWRLAELNGRQIEDSKAFITIDARERRLAGSDGCNRVFGTVTGGSGRINFAKTGTTKMACAETKDIKIQMQFINALQTANRYREKNGKLILWAGSRTVAKFAAVRRLPPERPKTGGLESMKWTLETTGSNKVIGVAALQVPFIMFDSEKKSAGGNTSCNSFGGTYSSSRGLIAITEVIVTMRACVEDNRMEVEKAMLEGLEKTNRYSIAGERLIFYRDKQELLSFRGELK